MEERAHFCPAWGAHRGQVPQFPLLGGGVTSLSPGVVAHVDVGTQNPTAQSTAR